MQEIWKDIKDFENLYQVSNLGNVKNYNTNKLLKAYFNEKGYLKICLQHKGLKKFFRVHRLVATAFIPNPNNLPEVNHIDGNKQNNKVDNLEWCTRQYNMKEASRLGLIKSNKSIIDQYDLQGNFIKQWSSIREASINLAPYSNNPETNISGVLRGKRKTAYGYIWKYANK